MTDLNWNWSDTNYKFTQGGTISQDEFFSDPQNNNILTVLRKEFKVTYCDFGYLRHGTRVMKVERSIMDFEHNLYIFSRADFPVPDNLFPDFTPESDMENWGIWSKYPCWSDEFAQWMLSELLNEEHWWSNSTCNLMNYLAENKKTLKKMNK